MKNHHKEYLIGVIAILIAAILWGTTGTAATFAPEVSAIAIGAVAMGGGGLLQAVFAIKGIKRAKHMLYSQWHYLISGAVMVAIYPLAFYASMRLAGVTIGTVVSIGSAPLFSALIERLFDRLLLTVRWMIGAMLGLTGMTLLCIAENGDYIDQTYSITITQGIFLGLLAGFCYAMYSWTARRMMQQGLTSSVAMGATFGVGGLLLIPVLLMTGAPLLASWNNAYVGLYMALIPMFLGYVCFGYGLARVPASTATTVTLFEPVVAAGLAMIIVGEKLPVLGWVGIVLVISCLIFITMPQKSIRQKRLKYN